MICARVAKRRLAVLPFAAAMALVAVSGADPAAAKNEQGKKRDPYAVTEREAGPAMLAVVSLKAQRVTVYDAEGPILNAPVSSGQTGYETPVGIYSVLQKNAEHYSNIYENAAMPHMQRITWSGVAFHGGPLPGYPASHGCVRLPFKFAERLFGLTDLGLRVVVSDDNVAPSPISHPLLFKRTPYRSEAGLITKATAMVGTVLGQKPTPPRNEPEDVTERAAVLEQFMTVKTAEAEAAEKEAEAPRKLVKERTADKKSADKAIKAAEKSVKKAADTVAYWERILGRAKSEKSKRRAEERKAKADAKLAEAEAKLEAVKAEVQPKVDAYQEAADALKAVEDVRDAALAEAREAERELAPVSVFISLKTQKLYVRQHFQPVLEVPVTIADPGRPIGTHTFTAVDYGEDGRQMRWNVVSIGGPSRDNYVDDYSYRDDDYDYDDYDRPRRRRKASKESSEPKPTDIAAATAALDRITIPPETAERISELVLPGSSLIISDEEASKETGKQTDFVVLVSGYPQGAIKKRPRRDPYYDDYFSYNDDYYDRRRRRRNSGPFFRWW